MKLKKPQKIVLYAALGLILLILLLNFIINSLLSSKVEDLLNNQNIEHYQISVKKVRFSLFDRSLLVKEFTLRPSDTAMLRLKERSFEKNSLSLVSTSSIKFKGISIFSALRNKNIIISQMIVNDLLIQRFKSTSTISGEKPSNEDKSLKLDSILLKGISGFELKHIKMRNMKVQLIDAVSGDLTFQNNPFNFELSGFKLVPKGEDYFSLEPVKDNFEIENIQVDIPDKQYAFSIDLIRFDFEDGHICIDGLALKPIVKASYLASTYKYNSEVYDLSLKKCCLHGFDIEKAETANGVFIDSVKITGLDLFVYKDKTKPFNTKKRPGLPHSSLKKMKFPLLISKIHVDEGSLRYEENLAKENLNMKVRMHDLKLTIDNLTSIERYRENPMKVDLNATFMNHAVLDVHLDFPLRDDQDTFDFYGSLSASEFKYYDDAIIPALGIKVLNGELNSLKFEARASSSSSTGTMTMLYNDLEAEVFKFKSQNHEKSGFLSWSVNNVLHKSNPGNNGKVRVAVMSFERVPYKGLGNYLWKTLQKGIVNTIAPFGMTEEKAEAKKKRRTKREMRKLEKESKS